MQKQDARRPVQLVEKPKSVLSSCKNAGGARGGEARLELDQMPRKALRGKACGERSEDFRAALQNENLALFQSSVRGLIFFFVMRRRNTIDKITEATSAMGKDSHTISSTPVRLSSHATGSRITS